MALKACPECGRQVSTKAVACPGCGHRDKPGYWEGVRAGMPRAAAVVFLLTVALFVIGVAAGPK